MGNGAIVPFFSSVADSATDLALADQNIATIRRFYEQVYDGHTAQPVANLVKDTVAIHRDGLVQNGVNALTEQIRETFIGRGSLRVELGQMVATTTSVAYTLTVSFLEGHVRMHVHGLCLTRLEDGLIAETWVTYGQPEPVT